MPFGTLPAGHGDPAAFCVLCDEFPKPAGTADVVELEAPELLVLGAFEAVFAAGLLAAGWLAFDATQGVAPGTLGVAGPVGRAVSGAPGVGAGAVGIGSGVPSTFVV